jgi:hypothetical protein
MSDDRNSAIKIVVADLGDWSKPANTLIEKCADAIGGLFQPKQITRLAEARAKADEIGALSEIRIDELQRRAATRFIAEETKKQINMEAIIRGALPDVGEAASPDKMDDDWVMNFFDKCRLVSDEKLRTMWSKILAEEANSPGNFSKRTVSLVGSLDKFEIDLFSTLCRFVVVSDNGPQPIIFNENDPIYNQFQLDFGSLIHLAEIGLIQFQANDVMWPPKHNNRLHYFGQLLELSFPESHPLTLVIGRASFSFSGLQLSSLPRVEPVPGFTEYLAHSWKRYGITVIQR